MADDHFLPEIVDPASGAPLPQGVRGELTITTLTKRALPLIRYRTGDVTMLTREPCRCGRTSARIARLKGRSDDMLVIKGVNVPSGSAWRSRWCHRGRFRAPKAKPSA